jgi:RNA polymerase subunit RPABC4/transcription elongation factor Spt4
MRCNICNAYIPEGAGKCLECGAGPEPEQVCQKCGTLSSAKARFCRKCGAGLVPPAPPNPEWAAHTDSPACGRCGYLVPTGIGYCPACGLEQPGAQTIKAPAVAAPAPPREDRQETDPLDGEPACPTCGATPRGSGRFCYECGRFLCSEVIDVICPACGSTSSLRYVRCQFCGADLPSPTQPRK